MSTRSLIAYVENGVYRCVYCHYDGYVEHNGAILAQHYNEARKVGQLIQLGDLSQLGDELDDCEFYGRDRGEDHTEAFEFNSMEELVRRARHSSSEYVYLYDHGTWSVLTVRISLTCDESENSPKFSVDVDKNLLTADSFS